MCGVLMVGLIELVNFFAEINDTSVETTAVLEENTHTTQKGAM